MAFCRLLGYILADGTISKMKNCNSYIGSIFLGHMIDVMNVKNDIESGNYPDENHSYN